MSDDVFDIDRWIREFPLDEVPPKRRCGSPNSSPSHLARLEQLRATALTGGAQLPATPCDVFVFAQGEPDRRDVTKVNGLPYRPSGLSWPLTADGEPMTFLAQFRFIESNGLVGALPGDVLVVFASDDSLLPFDQPQETLRFEWYPMGIEELMLAEECAPPRWRFAHCYGIRHRSVDYPSVEAEEVFMRVVSPTARRRVPDDLVVRPLCRLHGMKIGGAPLWYKSGETASGPDWEPLRGRFLCSLSSISPARDEQFPWVNHPAPRRFDKFTFEGDVLLFCSNGFLLNFFIDDSGQVTWGMQLFT